MAEEDRNADAPVRQHVKRVLAQISVLKNRLRAQEQASKTGALDSPVEGNQRDHDPDKSWSES